MDSVIREPENSASIFINTESGEVLHDADAACPTRVMRAVQAGKVDVVMEWIVAGGHPNAVAFSGDSMVHFAAEANQLEMVNKLIAAGADVNIANPDGGAALHAAAAAGYNLIVDTLIAGKANVAQTVGPPEDATALLMAAVGGHDLVVQALLRAKANADDRDGQGATALIQAAAQGHAKVVLLMLTAGCRTDIVDSFQMTALDVVTKEVPQTAIARTLIAHMVGSQCKVDGLVARSDLNGALGTVTEFVEAKGRFAVKFDSGEVVAVKPSNLSRA